MGNHSDSVSRLQVQLGLASGTESRQMTLALLLSLLFHALLLSLTFGDADFGLPGLSFFWKERRVEASTLRVELTPPPLPAAAPPEKPARKIAEAARIVPRPVLRPVVTPVVSAQAPKERNVETAVAEAKPVPMVTPQPEPEPEVATVPAASVDVAEPEAPSPAMEEPAAPAAPAAEVVQTITDPELPVREAEVPKLDHPVREIEPEEIKTAQLEAARVEAARREAARLEAERQEAVRQEAARLETERREAERKEAERKEVERREAERIAAERRVAELEAQRLEAARREAARIEAERREAERREAARLEAERLEALRLEALRAATAREEEERREARLRAIGRQLDEEAAQRDAATSRSTLPLSLSTARRVRLWGRTDPDEELVKYAEAWARKIQLNTPVDTVRELAKRPHSNPMVTVAIRSDGTLESVTIVVSSGVAEVDEAIRRIAQSHAPYQAFPPGLARRVDVVEIRRTWYFDVAIRLD